jgi:hypothetical protein
MVKFYYGSGEEVKAGDIIRIRDESGWSERFVDHIMQPGSRESTDSGFPKGGVIIVDRKNSWVVECPNSGILNKDYEFSRRRDDKFYYLSRDEVKVGDIVRVWDGSGWVEGFVEEILKSGTQQAKEWGFPNGGVFIKDPHHGMVLEHPDSGILNEDFELFSRRKK